jgi:PhnB protein
MLHRRLSVLPLALALLAPACGPKAPPPKPPVTQEPEKAPVAPIPEGFFTLTPYITVQGVDAAVDFYTKVFGAQKVYSLAGPDGKTMHAEIVIGDSKMMIGEENEAQGAKSPLALGGSPATLVMYVDDANAVFATAIGAGAKESVPLEEQYWGDLYGVINDPFGHRWALATHVEDLTDEQMKQRAEIANQPKKKKKPKKGTPPAWKSIAGTPATDPTPAEYHTITIALTTSEANAAIAFYKAAFGAADKKLMARPDGKVEHAELTIGTSTLMLSDEFPDKGGTSAATLGGSPVTVHMYTDNVDVTFSTATGAGGKETMALAVMPWGDKYGTLVDPAGFPWSVATHVEDLTPEQIQEKMKAQAGPPASDPAAAPADPAATPPATGTPPAAAATPPAATP